MKSTLLRTGSKPIHNITRSSSSGSLLQNSPVQSSPRISFPSYNGNVFIGLRRSYSDTDMIRSAYKLSRVGRVGSVSYADMGMIAEEELMEGSSSNFGNGSGNNKGNYNFGCGRNGENNYNNNQNNNIKEYYLELLKSNPSDLLLLRNYGKYLLEVEKNVEKAEEYYGRAILESGGDGELLCLYANLIWETHRDQVRAQSYFDQALHASPHDSTVLGSYAHFLWETEDEDDNRRINQGNVVVPPTVGVF